MEQTPEQVLNLPEHTLSPEGVISQADTTRPIQYNEDFSIGPARHKRTLDFIRAAINLDAIDEGWLYEQKGWMLNGLKRYREAVDAFERARRLGYARDGWLYEQKIYALIQLKRYKEALETSEQALRLDYPGNDRIYGQKGHILTQLQRFEEASEAFKQASNFSLQEKPVEAEDASSSS